MGILRRLSFFLGTVGLTLPIFWIGLLALIVGSLWLGWFPGGGRFDFSLIKPANVTGFLTIDSLLEGDLAKFGAAVNSTARSFDLALAAEVGQTDASCAQC